MASLMKLFTFIVVAGASAIVAWLFSLLPEAAFKIFESSFVHPENSAVIIKANVIAVWCVNFFIVYSEGVKI